MVPRLPAAAELAEGSRAVSARTVVPFDVGVSHYDEPLPDAIDDLEALKAGDRFRFANVLRAWVEVEDGRIVDGGYLGKGHIGSTTVRLGKRSVTFEAVALPDLQRARSPATGSPTPPATWPPSRGWST